MWRSPEPVDYLYADIWDRLGSPEAATDMRTMCRNLRPKAAGFWEMEANFVSFLARNQCKPLVTRLQFGASVRHLDAPVSCLWASCVAVMDSRCRHPANLRGLAGTKAG
jgi:hypothetical protein